MNLYRVDGAASWVMRLVIRLTGRLFYEHVALPVLSRAFIGNLITARQYHLLSGHFNPVNRAGAAWRIIHGLPLPTTLSPLESWLSECPNALSPRPRASTNAPAVFPEGRS